MKYKDNYMSTRNWETLDTTSIKFDTNFQQIEQLLCLLNYKALASGSPASKVSNSLTRRLIDLFSLESSDYHVKRLNAALLNSKKKQNCINK